jgi:hypothetical protein
VIEGIDELPPDEQAKVIQHAFKLACHRRLGADKFGELPTAWPNPTIRPHRVRRG